MSFNGLIGKPGVTSLVRSRVLATSLPGGVREKTKRTRKIAKITTRLARIAFLQNSFFFIDSFFLSF